MKFSFLLAGLLALGPRAAPAGTLPDAARLRRGSVSRSSSKTSSKAISFSRSHQGYYFSFGAPYPKQSLSVWVTQELYEQLPRDPGLMRRRVRISSQLETVRLARCSRSLRPDDFELREVKDAMLSKSFLDGRMDRAAPGHEGHLLRPDAL